MELSEKSAFYSELMQRVAEYFATLFFWQYLFQYFFVGKKFFTTYCFPEFLKYTSTQYNMEKDNLTCYFIRLENLVLAFERTPTEVAGERSPEEKIWGTTQRK
jgi:hypothetical protein